jgi:hypothetical protein
MDFQTFFGYSSLFHFFILSMWFFLFVFAKKWIYKIHSKWFNIPQEDFDLFHYKFMGIYKLLILTLAFVPYLTLLTIQ